MEIKLGGAQSFCLLESTYLLLLWYFSGSDNECHEYRRINVDVFIFFMCPTFIFFPVELLHRLKILTFSFNSEFRNDSWMNKRDRWVVYTWKEINLLVWYVASNWSEEIFAHTLNQRIKEKNIAYSCLPNLLPLWVSTWQYYQI